jgi:peptidoglycan/LPS O-acetylase OafA/YrhL
VILFHAFPNNFKNGYLGVDVFFVISGFVITPLIIKLLSHDSKKIEIFHKLRTFYLRRFYRLVPALLSTIFFATFMLLLLSSPDDHRKIARQAIASIWFIGNIGAYKYSGDYFSPNSNPLVHTWSVAVESQIYIVLPIMFVLGAWIFRRNSSKILLSIITLFSFILFLYPNILNYFYTELRIYNLDYFAFYSTPNRIWQFTIGGILYIVSDKQIKLQNKKILNSIILCFFLLILILPIQIDTKLATVVTTLTALAVIYFNSLIILPDTVFRILVWIGDRSYSIYLVHMPLIWIVEYSPLPIFTRVQNSSFLIFLAAVFSIVLGAINYEKIEKKFRFKGDSVSGKTKLASLGKTKIMIYLLLLSSLLGLMDLGSQRKYWGMDKSVLRPPPVASLDSNCDRDSEFGGPCEYKSPTGDQTVLLIGDSHAAHLSQAIINAATNMSWNSLIWTHSGCHVNLDLDNNSKLDSCIKINRKMAAYVADKKPDLIVVSQFITDTSDIKELTEALLLLKKNSKVVVVENIPVFPDGEFMKTLPLIMRQYNPPFAFRASQMNKDFEVANQNYVELVQAEGIETIKLNDLFCNSGTCVRYFKGEWLYRDTSHLSESGGNLTIPIFEKLLSTI